MRLADICSLTDFQRNTKKHIVRLKKSGRPEVLTVNGKAEVVVQDAKAYQKMLDMLERAEVVAAIKRGLEDMKAGRTKPAEQVLDEIRSGRKISARA